MSLTLSFWLVRAVVETDENLREGAGYLVYAYDRKEAEDLVESMFLAEHPHDLCPKNGPHVGLDTVLKDETRPVPVRDPAVLASWTDMDEDYRAESMTPPPKINLKTRRGKGRTKTDDA